MSAAMARTQVPVDVVERLRALCVALPQVREEGAWVGTRWRVCGKTFVHVLAIDDGWPPAYAKAAGSRGPLVVMTFRSPRPEAEVHAYTWAPFFRPPWFRDIVGMRLDAHTDWDEVGACVLESWRHLAPKSLVAARGA